VLVATSRRHELQFGRRSRHTSVFHDPKNFSGKYENRITKDSVGHNLRQEAPQAFARAVVDVDHY
jgi:hypothetical protein